MGAHRRIAPGSQDARRHSLLLDGRPAGLSNEAAPTICYARVSSYDQKADLERQHAALEAYCAAKGWRSETIKELGSGMNYSKKGLQRLLEMILKRQMKRLVLTHKDRLLRFGAELVFTLERLSKVPETSEAFSSRDGLPAPQSM